MNAAIPAVATRPTATKVPATAPVFSKNPDEPLDDDEPETPAVPVLPTTRVTVYTLPSVPVVTTVSELALVLAETCEGTTFDVRADSVVAAEVTPAADVVAAAGVEEVEEGRTAVEEEEEEAGKEDTTDEGLSVELGATLVLAGSEVP